MYYKFELFFEVREIFKKKELIYHILDKRLPMFWKDSLENIFILLYTSSDYYGVILGTKGAQSNILPAHFILKRLSRTFPLLIKLRIDI